MKFREGNKIIDVAKVSDSYVDPDRDSVNDGFARIKDTFTIKQRFNKKAIIFCLTFAAVVMAAGSYWQQMIFFKVFGTIYALGTGAALMYGVLNLVRE